MPVVAGSIVAGSIVAGVPVQGGVVGSEGGVTTSITLAGAGWDVRHRAGLDGALGCTRKGAYLESASSYIWWTHDNGAGVQVGYDPGDHVPALSAKTGIQVQLGAGALTGASVASATRSATGAGGSGSVVVLDGAWAVGGVAFDSRGTAAAFGDRRAAPNSTGNPIDVALTQHFTAPAGPVLVTAIGVYLATPDAGEPIRVAIYTGGSAASLVGTTVAVQGVITPTATAGWHWLHLTPAQALTLAGESCRIAIKGEAVNTHPGLWPTGTTAGSDLTDQAIEIYSGTIDPDPTVAWPTSLSGLLSGTAAVTMMVAVVYSSTPFVSDGSWEGTLGVHSDDVLGAALQSDLTGIDPLGANVTMPVRSPAIHGMTVVAQDVAVGSTHTGQFRQGIYAGGAVANPVGATLASDGGQTSGSATNAWVASTAGAGNAIAADTLHHLDLRGNGGVTVRYAAWNAGVVDPPGAPTDYIGGATAEYEINSASTAHSTNDANAFETPFTTAPGSASQPGNFPGLRLRLRVDGDSVG